MYYSSLLLLLLLCLNMGACASSKKRKADSSAETETHDVSAPIAPGSARVLAEIIDLEPAPRGYHCVLRIQTVQAYGSSTPPLPEGTQITALVSEQFLASVAPDRQAVQVLPPGELKHMTLSYQQVPALQEEISTPAWRIVSIR